MNEYEPVKNAFLQLLYIFLIGSKSTCACVIHVNKHTYIYMYYKMIILLIEI